MTRESSSNLKRNACFQAKRLRQLFGLTAILALIGGLPATQAGDLSVENRRLQEADEQENTSPARKFYEMGIYEKARTQFDGVTFEESVTYLQLQSTQGVSIPVMTTGTHNEAIDFTVMLWFKLAEDERTDIMYLFSFENSIACYFTLSNSVMCDSPNRQKLQVLADEVVPGHWIHLTFSARSDGFAYLQLSDQTDVVGYDETSKFSMTQTQKTGWSICLGDCQDVYGFNGGVRELVVRSSFISKEIAQKVKNNMFTYSSDFKAYYRMADVHNMFTKDEFVDRAWTIVNGHSDMSVMIGSDNIPNDVCPTTYNQREFIDFDGKVDLDVHKFKKSLKQKRYEYTLETTIMFNETTCVQRDPVKARSTCNIFLIDEVAMLYFYTINMAKVHFFANKNYYESQTPPMFLPYDQWVTFQLSFRHYGGWQVAVWDQNGKLIVQQEEEMNMQEMRPRNSMHLFRDFVGYVENFKFCESLLDVPSNESPTDCLFDLTFDNYGVQGTTVQNKGTEDDLKFNTSPNRLYLPFQVSELGSGDQRGTYEGPDLFDGIACNDDHISIRLDEKSSYLRFDTPPLEQELFEATVEFWFKMEDESSYQNNTFIFLMRHEYEEEIEVGNKTETQDAVDYYFEIYIKGGELVCAPFGSEQVRDPLVVFSDFSYENEDEYGWWHISCGFSYQNEIVGYLTNGKIKQEDTYGLSSLPYFIPKDSMEGSFGQPDHPLTVGTKNLLVKEMRFWSSRLHEEQIDSWRYRQIDPTLLPEGALLNYYRLASGSPQVVNYASLHPDFKFQNTDARLSGFSLVSDFFLQEEFYYDTNLGQVVSQFVKTYHVVCPLYTYHKDGYCYSQPINKAIITVLPSWDSNQRILFWRFSLNHSSMVDINLLPQLRADWSTNDSVLSSVFGGSLYEYDHEISSSVFRQEAQYDIVASLANLQMTFFNEDKMKFVPNNCKWFYFQDLERAWVKNDFTTTPGDQDIVVKLDLQVNPDFECSDFTFFNTFDSIDFDFVLPNSNEYIIEKPILRYNLANIVQGNSTEGQDTVVDPESENLQIVVTIPKEEQSKFPVQTDIDIIMTIKWTSSKYRQQIDSAGLTFQNALYHIKFEPQDRDLVASLEINTDIAIRNETVILDASDSFITNMPAVLRKRGLTFSWLCSEKIKELCEGQTFEILSIPWEKALSIVQFKYTYDISVIISWSKEDGSVEAKTVGKKITWYDVAQPAFDITVYPTLPVLTTNTRNTVFTMVPETWTNTQFRDYNVVWTVTPALNSTSDSRSVSYGRIFQVYAGKWATNTYYEVTANVTYKALTKLNTVKTVKFETLEPPSGGTVLVQPPFGTIGTPFTVVCKDWISNNPPAVYNVYQTYNTEGTRKGRVINADPIPVDQLYQYVARNVNPVIVEVTDESGEIVSFILAPDFEMSSSETGIPPSDDLQLEGTQIENLPDEDQEDLCIEDCVDEVEEEVEEETTPAEDETTEEEVVDNTEEVDSTDDTEAIDEADSTEDTTSSDEGIADWGADEASTAEDAPTDESATSDESTAAEEENMADKLNLIAKMAGDDSLDKKITFTGTLKDDEVAQEQGLLENTVQVVYRLKLLGQIQDDINLFLGGEVTDLTSEEFLFVTMPVLKNMCSTPEYCDEEVATRLMVTVNNLMEVDSFEYSLETIPEFQKEYLKTLEYMNQYARLNDVSLLQDDVRAHVASMEDRLCSYPSDDLQMYEGIGEINFMLYKFDERTVELGTSHVLSVADGSFTLETADFLPFTESNPGFGSHCAQVTSIKGATGVEEITIWSEGTLEVNILEMATMERHALHEFFDHSQTSFTLDTSFQPGQTVCMAFSRESLKWEDELCMTEVREDDFSVRCSCNAFRANRVGLFTDESRPVGEALNLPVITINEDVVIMNEEVVIPVIIDDEVITVVVEAPSSGAFLATTVVLMVLTIAGGISTTIADKKDLKALEKRQSYETENMLVQQVATFLMQNEKEVSLRADNLQAYTESGQNNMFAYCLTQIHPLFAPLASFRANQSRLMRFMAYALQVNIVALLIMATFGAHYRSEESSREEEKIDGKDIGNMLIWLIFSSILLLPWMSEALCKLLESKFSQEKGIMEPQRVVFRYVMYGVTIALNLAMVIWAAATTKDIPAMNQVCTCMAVWSGIVGATLGTNMIRVGINSCLADKEKPTRWLLSAKAISIADDMKAVIKARKELNSKKIVEKDLPVMLDQTNDECGEPVAEPALYQVFKTEDPVNFSARKVLDYEQTHERDHSLRAVNLPGTDCIEIKEKRGSQTVMKNKQQSRTIYREAAAAQESDSCNASGLSSAN